MFVRSLFFGTGPHALFADAHRRAAGRIASRRSPRCSRHSGATAGSPASRAAPRPPRCSASCASRPPTPTTARSCRACAAGWSCRSPESSSPTARWSSSRTPMRPPRCPRCTCCSSTARTSSSASARRPGAARGAMGIPRLRMPRGAPSRSTLKLAEAIQTFLGDDARRPAARRHEGGRPRRRTGRMDLAARAPRLARHRRRQRSAQGRGGAGSAGHPPARRRVDLRAAAARRLDGLRHRRAAVADRRAGRALDRRRATRAARSSTSSCR